MTVLAKDYGSGEGGIAVLAAPVVARRVSPDTVAALGMLQGARFGVATAVFAPMDCIVESSIKTIGNVRRENVCI